MSVSGWSLVVASYLLGSVPFGLLLGRLRGVDVRGVGSGNIGATNVMRATGRTVGILTFLLDAGKGAVGPGVALGVGWGPGWAAAAALAAVLGHCHSPFLRLRGGKGVATLVGGFATLAPGAAALGGAAFAVALLAWGYVAVASQALALTLAAASWAWHGAGDPRTLAGIAGAALVAWRHRDNGRRLRHVTEARALRRRAPGGGVHG